MKHHLFFQLVVQCYRPIILTVALALVASTAAARMQYVQPSSEIPVRRGQGTEYKIISIVPDGTAVEFLEEQNGWARVKLGNGKEGWILKRYLNSSPPPSKQLTLLTEEKQLLLVKVDALQKQLAQLTDVQGQTAQELSSCIAERTDIKESFQELEKDTVDVVQTKEALHNAKKKIDQLQQENTDVKIANSVLQKNESIKWFLAGTGVLLVGWFLGRFSKSSRKRKPSLLS